MLEFVEKSTLVGAFEPGIGFDHVVIGDKWEEIIGEIRSEWIREGIALGVGIGDYPHGSLNRSLVQPKWRYAKRNFKRLWISHARRDNDTRAITLWVGQKLVSDCLAREEAIAPRIRKRINDRLRRHFGIDEYDIWFDVEATRTDPLDIHLHGLLEVYDPDVWSRKSRYDKLKKCLREAVGTDISRNHRSQIRLVKYKSEGWIHYSGKRRRQNGVSVLKTPLSNVHPAISHRLHASTRRIRQRAARIYEEARLIANASIDGSISVWTSENWRKLQGMRERHFD